MYRPLNPRSPRRTTASLWLGAGLSLAALPAAAQTVQPAAPAQLPEVTVTATKQTRALEDVAASISVYDADQLDTAAVTELADIARATPGLSFQPMGQSGVQPPVMRGLNANVTSFSSSVALVVDGVPTLRGFGFDDALLGIERVEIIRGPQSTLYGRNAEAGVINVVSRKPDNTPYAALALDLGSRNKQALRADTSAALLSDTLYLGVAGEWFRQDGFIDNTDTGRREDDRARRSGRVTLRWTPDPRTDATLRYTERRYRDDASLWGPVDGDRTKVRSGTPGYNDSESRTLSLDVSHQRDDGLRFSSLTAHSRHDDRILQDTDFQPADLFHLGRDYRFETWSQEFRLEGQQGDTSWLAGLYLDRDELDLDFEQKMPMALTRTRSSQRSHTAALFTHWEVALSPRWRVNAGLRAERSELRFALHEQARQQRAWTRFSPKLALQYHWREQNQWYASLSDGFRAGGFNTFAPDTYRTYQPEKVRSLEVGAKGLLWQRRLSYNVALYTMRVEDMQVQQMGSVPGQVFMTNAASARASGAEAELQYLFGDGWQVQASLAYNRTRFRSFRDGDNRYDGNRNPFAPAIDGHLGLRYDAPSGWHAQARLSGAGRIYVDAANSRRYRRPGYTTVDMSAGHTWGRTEVVVYVNNATDKRYDTVGFPGSTITVYSPPREAGIRLKWTL